jgi:hypothetical protein
MKLSLFSLALASTAAAVAVAEVPTYSATVLIDRVTLLCTLLAPPTETQRHRAIKTPSDVLEQTKLRQNRLPEELLANEPVGMQQYVTVLGGSIDAVETRVTERCPNGVRANPEAPEAFGALLPPRHLRGDHAPARRLATKPTEVRKIVDSGNPANRIDVVFMGDGYTLAEKDKFFGDINRLTNDMFTGDTFSQYLPLFNIWAAYVPSAVSGIGVNNKPRDTPFKLFREGKELRAIFSGSEQAIIDVCLSIGSKSCEFPTVIANDDLYGGLGSPFVIATRSPTSGTIVLRHEMGHDFGGVGEEYDGGEVYRGANSASSTKNVPWKHWLTDPTRLVEEKAAQLYQKHMWADLEQSGPYTIEFTSTGTYKRWFMLFTVSGADTDDSISVTLDGKPLEWKSSGFKDRSFYEFSSSTSGFSAGRHQLVVKSTRASDGPVAKMLCHAVIHEYADESGFKLDDPTAIGIYPTYNINKGKSYRPNNERCLMRNMTSTHFCKVCQENMWLRFLQRVKLIDAVQISGRTVSLKLIPLAQFRLPTDKFIKDDPAVALAEKYSVKWMKSDGQEELVQFRDKFTGVDFTGLPAGTYKAVVTFTTPNVRVDTENWSTAEQTFTLV